MPMYHLDNSVQYYEWGTSDEIPRLLRIENPTRKPFAELWMGAHPKAPSIAKTPEGDIPLSTLIERDPQTTLGTGVRQKFGATLPFLFKVLSAARPLSIQVHPSKLKAAKGFEKENRLALPIDAPERNYRDPNHKPELIVALGDFWGLCGFRPIEEILRLVKMAAPREYKKLVGNLESNPGKVELSVLIYRFLTFSENRKKDFLYLTVHRIAKLLETTRDKKAREVFSWVHELITANPGDIGALAPFVMNLFQLKQGQALFLPPGQIHAYLRGTGLEIMANSDNVLRGALTSKRIDVPELISALSFSPGSVHPLEATKIDEAVEEYPDEAEEFRLDRIRLSKGIDRGRRKPGPEILLCLEGYVEAVDETVRTGKTTILRGGESVFVPSDTEAYTLRGEGLIFRAGVSA